MVHFVQAPDKRNIQDGVRLLRRLGALTKGTDNKGAYRLTPMGKQLAQLLSIQDMRMVLKARKYGAVRELMVITSALSIQDPREKTDGQATSIR